MQIGLEIALLSLCILDKRNLSVIYCWVMVTHSNNDNLNNSYDLSVNVTTSKSMSEQMLYWNINMLLLFQENWIRSIRCIMSTWNFDGWWKLASHPNVLRPLRALLGNDIILLDSRFICKYPEKENGRTDNAKQFVAWHQDVRWE